MSGCPRHGTQLNKHFRLDKQEFVFSCPKQKCGYKENEEGEMI